MFSSLGHNLLAGVGLFSVTVGSSLLTLYIAKSNPSWMNSGSAKDSALRYDLQFDGMQAVSNCQEKAFQKFSGTLLRSEVDWRSTRYQEEQDQFVVLLNGSTGNLQHHEPVTIYCYIDPDSEEVSYFRAYDSNNSSIFSNGLSLDDMVRGLRTD